MRAKMATQDKDLIFALDIGTRSIIGVVGRAQEGIFQVLALESAEHSQRAMMDGQIDNIEEVAALAKTVTGRLEKTLKTRLERVCVAAAGRALRTQQGNFALELPQDGQVVTETLISQLEAGAVSDAESTLRQGEEGGGKELFLVGYTVVQYRLDGYPLLNLLHHSGKVAEAQVVATFLPGEVVESLYSAMNAAGLQVASMTLEPIAAMNAVIPQDIRLLNLALVDIGAGTADIAVCREGSVTGYTMATLAGDEITEAIMRCYLVDFHMAEQMKRSFDGTSDIPYTNILGLEEKTTAQDLLADIQGAMDSLAEEIARQVTEVNGGSAPSAVFLVGGGSRLQGLREKVAQCLSMDEKRVAVVGGSMMKGVEWAQGKLDGPELATPLGIALSAGMGLLNDSYRILLNGEPAKLFRSGDMTLRDVLLMNGYGYSDMVGRTGKSMAVTLDGKRVTFRGEPAAPAVLQVNGQEATLPTVIHAGDKIQFVPARPGEDAHPTLEQLVGEAFPGRVLVNNVPASGKTTLADGDVILTNQAPKAPPAEEPAPAPTEEPAPALVAQPQPLPVGAVTLELNGKHLTFPAKLDGSPYYLMDMLEETGLDFQKLDRPVRLEVNGQEAGFQQPLKTGDKVEIYCVGAENVPGQALDTAGD